MKAEIIIKLDDGRTFTFNALKLKYDLTTDFEEIKLIHELTPRRKAKGAFLSLEAYITNENSDEEDKNE